MQARLPGGVVSPTSASSMGSLPAHAWRRKSASMRRAASIILASARVSFGGSAERSTAESTGSKGAAEARDAVDSATMAPNTPSVFMRGADISRSISDRLS